MQITTIDVAEVTEAVVQMLKDDPRLQDLNATIERGEAVNEDASRCPWIGIYPLRVPFPARTLGLGGGYRAQRNELVVLCQDADPSSGAKCQDRVGALVKAVTSVLLTDTSLKGTVEMLEEFEVSYPDYRKDENAFMQTAAVQFTGVTNVRGG